MLRPPRCLTLFAIVCANVVAACSAATNGDGQGGRGSTSGGNSASAGGGAVNASGGTSTGTSGGVQSANGGLGGTPNGSSGGSASGSGGNGNGANGNGGALSGSGGSANGNGGNSNSNGGGSNGGSATSGGGKANGGAVSGGATNGGNTGSAGAGAALWVATDGVDTNPGTEAMPLKTLGAAHTKASAGTTIWVKAGTFTSGATINITKNGTEASPIRIWAVAGARPVFDFASQPRGMSSARGVELKGDYWHIRGIDFINAGDNCIHVTGAHNTLEWLQIHGCDDTGIQVSVDSSQASDATRGAYNTVLNCDSWANYDSTTGGENADGFAAKLYIGTGNVFRGCRAWSNSDDGWDLFAANDVVTIDGCWAFGNGKTPSGQSNPNGDGNGFKLGGAPAAGDANQGGAVHVVTNSFGFENLACGFVRNNNPSVPKLSMCGGRSNPKGDYCSLTNSGTVSMTMTASEAAQVKRNADGSLPAIH